MYLIKEPALRAGPTRGNRWAAPAPEITPHKCAWHSLSLRCRGSGPDTELWGLIRFGVFEHFTLRTTLAACDAM